MNRNLIQRKDFNGNSNLKIVCYNAQPNDSSS